MTNLSKTIDESLTLYIDDCVCQNKCQSVFMNINVIRIKYIVLLHFVLNTALKMMIINVSYVMLSFNSIL